MMMKKTIIYLVYHRKRKKKLYFITLIFFQTQHERIVINNWRRNAYFQPHLMYPNVLFSTAAHCLPAPATYEYHNRIINCVAATAATGDDNSRPLLSDRPTYFSDVQEPIYQKSNDDKSISNTSTVQHAMQQQPVQPVQQIVREIPCPSLPLMPIYHSDTNTPLFSELFRLQGSQLPLRNVDTQPFAQHMMAPTPTIFDNNKPTIHAKEMPNNNQRPVFYSNRTSFDLPNSYHDLPINDGLNHNKYLSSISSSGNYGAEIVPQSKLSFDVPLTKLASDFQSSQAGKSQQTFTNNQPYSSIGYANQPQHTHYTNAKSQFSLIEDPTSQKSVDTISTSAANTLTSQQQKVYEPMSSYVSSQPMSNYASYNPTIQSETVKPLVDDFSASAARTTDEIKPRETISITAEKNFERNITEKTDAPWKSDALNDVYSYDKDLDGYSVSSHVESIDSTIRKPINTPSVADADNLSSLVRSSPKNINSFSLDNGIQQSVSSSKSNEIPKEEHYRYETTAATENTYDKELSNDLAQQVDAETAKRSHFFLSSDNQEESTRFSDKRRSSIDSGSMVKSLDDDNELQAKSIAANVRRRYSVAANLLDLEKNRTNIEPFYLQSTPAINYQNDANNLTDMNRSDFGNEQFSTTANVVSTFSNGQENKRNSIDLGVKIEDITESGGSVSYADRRISVANISQQPVEAIHDRQYGHTEVTDVNQSDITSYYMDENNAVTTPAAEPAMYGAPYSTYETDDQAFVENALDNLHLDDRVEQNPTDEVQLKQFDDGTDRIRISGTHRYVICIRNCSCKINFTKMKLIRIVKM